MNALIKFFTLDTSDSEVMRAQFSSFSRHIPLLYVILVINTVAITLTSFSTQDLLKTAIIPALISAFSLYRAWWWLSEANPDDLSDEQILGFLRRTCWMAVIQTALFSVWVIWIYPSVSELERGNLSFYLALSQVSTVCCLMTVRLAATLVAMVSTVSFALYFSWVDDARLLPQALVLCCVCGGMGIITHGYYSSFFELVKSRRALDLRQRETEKLSRENRRIAFTDALTGMPNRRELLERLDRLNRQERVPRNTLAMVFIDLDGFKQVNDEHGHHAGDALIRTICQRLQEHCPDDAILARVGGDEFCALIETADASVSAQAQAVALATRLLQEIALPALIDRHVLQVGASIGVAANLDPDANGRELLRRADLAMYHAKTKGKGQIALYDKALDQGRLHRLDIEAQIGRALSRDEFDIAYQPIIDAQSGRVRSAEALLRWPRRPEGALMPDEFIEIAEATGQIHPLGLHVLSKACTQLQSFDPIKLSVNVSPAQFRHPSFEQQVLAILEATGFPPERLKIEVTESYLLANPQRALEALSVLKAKGISVALDDFGTGFTSIHYLQSFGFTHIKIDKSLTAGLASGNKATQLVSGAITMASALDMEVIAEGVEREEQVRLLCEAGCHGMQGFYFGRPMPLDRFTQYCKERARDESHVRAVARA